MKSLNNGKKFLPRLLTNIKKEVNNLLSYDLYDLLYIANRVREEYCGNTIKFCSIINAKSGRCSEDCKFCGQSGRYNSNPPLYNLKNPEEILKSAKEAEEKGSKRFCIVTSGRGIKDNDWENIFKTIKLLKKETTLLIEASLGCIDIKHARSLKDAGLTRYNHNLETSPGFFPKICTTHTFNDRLKTAKIIKKAGISLCCGGIFGLGEDWDSRIELAFILKDLRPDSVPLNFLHPKKGTPLENNEPLSPIEILRIIAIFRLIMPSVDLSICGGREYNLRSLQSWMFYAGANATMLGNYLTTKGNSPEQDLQMIKDLQLCPEQF